MQIDKTVQQQLRDNYRLTKVQVHYTNKKQEYKIIKYIWSDSMYIDNITAYIWNSHFAAYMRPLFKFLYMPHVVLQEKINFISLFTKKEKPRR